MAFTFVEHNWHFEPTPAMTVEIPIRPCGTIQFGVEDGRAFVRLGGQQPWRILRDIAAQAESGYTDFELAPGLLLCLDRRDFIVCHRGHKVGHCSARSVAIGLGVLGRQKREIQLFTTR